MATAAKAAPLFMPPTVAALTELGIDGHVILKVAAIALGLSFGAMWRAGMLRGEGKPWETVRADLAVSALIGGGNAILSLAISEMLGVGALLAMGLGVIVGATGLRALPAIRSILINAIQRWALGDKVVVLDRDGKPIQRERHIEQVIKELDKAYPDDGPDKNTPA